MKLSRNELIDILNSVGFDYELDSDISGIFTAEGKHLLFSDMQSPKEYYSGKATQKT